MQKDIQKVWESGNIVYSNKTITDKNMAYEKVQDDEIKAR